MLAASHPSFLSSPIAAAALGAKLKGSQASLTDRLPIPVRRVSDSFRPTDPNCYVFRGVGRSGARGARGRIKNGRVAKPWWRNAGWSTIVH